MQTKGRALASVDPGKLRLRAEGTAARSLATSFSSYQVCATCQPDSLSHYIVGCAVFLFLFRILLLFLLCVHGVQFCTVVQTPAWQWGGGTETADRGKFVSTAPRRRVVRPGPSPSLPLSRCEMPGDAGALLVFGNRKRENSQFDFEAQGAGGDGMGREGMTRGLLVTHSAVQVQGF